MQSFLIKFGRIIGSALLSLFMMLLGPKVLGWIIVLLLRKFGKVVPKKYQIKYIELVDRISSVWGVGIEDASIAKGELSGKE